MTVANIVILVCSALGFFISLYFTLVYYRLMRPDAAIVPWFCRMDERTCQSLLNTRNARILGAPNFLFGVLYYAAMALFITGAIRISLALATFAALSTVVLGVYLVYGLIVTLKTRCVLCYTTHACNLLIFAALVVKRFA